ncbi:serine/threonine receptor-like kinase NFP [Phoenix dactylifera]|uniref:Serine/threonine receptor-like kinase NFP n=1 Tax=Phoenix dactylifera TaxID=42345 RepID=A0A8B7D515_PHODC|nr:serine/threonine receptor-like kinase NFP [Phoenix dactylifera]
MEPSLLSFQALPFIFLLFHTSLVAPQTIDTNTTLFSCSANSSSSCKTFVVYRTQSPEYLEPGDISDLFGVSPLSITRANNLSSEEGAFLPDQLLLVPISCSCTGNQSCANTTYQIKEGDTFYLVSIYNFENLTDYDVIMDLNPTLKPSKLKPGQEVIIPLYCKCPTNTQMDQGINFLITYVWQAGDEISKLSEMMNSSTDAIATENNYRDFSAAAARPILVPVSEMPRLPPPLYTTTTAAHHKPKSNRTIIIASSTVGAVLALVLCSLLVLAYFKCRPKETIIRKGSSLEAVDLPGSKKPCNDQPASPMTKGDKLLAEISQFIDKMAMFENKAILEATMNLDEVYRIGVSVYRATLNGRVFAVKQAKAGDVKEELNILQIVSHANLIKLAGISYTDADGDFFLVFEFAENGSLDNWLHSKSSSSNSASFLSWRQRLNIALDVANGLQYMHEHTRPSIVHRDIRTSNILLNAHFKAKISNFSMAKPATVGMTLTSDVFAFGVVLLELLSGKKAMEAREGGEIGMLWKEIRMVLEDENKRKERMRKWIDPNLEGFYPMDGAISLAEVARACTAENSSERPRMAEIVFNLSVIAQSCTDSFEKVWMPNSEENIQITNSVFAR